MSSEGKVLALVPEQFELQSVSLHTVLITLLASGVGTIGAIYYGFPLYGVVLAGLIPWLPLFYVESVAKYEHYGFYALMGVFVILQLGHLAEHAVQIAQMWISGGNVTEAHGVFGALDRELVHFAWDSLVWLGVCYLLVRLGPHNRWLWISFVAASLHEVEHVFLYYLDRFHPEFYNAGGTTGLLAEGGLIGTPAQRPYLHFIYNFFVVMPLVMAFWDETKRAYNVYLARALPSLSRQEKASTSAQLDRREYDAGEVIVRQGDVADNFYIVSDGHVEVVREGDDGEEHLAVLGPGHFFGEIGLLTGRPRTATVRALDEVEVLALDQSEFGMLVSRSHGGAADVDSELHERLTELRERDIEVDLGVGSNGGNGHHDGAETTLVGTVVATAAKRPARANGNGKTERASGSNGRSAKKAAAKKAPAKRTPAKKPAKKAPAKRAAAKKAPAKKAAAKKATAKKSARSGRGGAA